MNSPSHFNSNLHHQAKTAPAGAAATSASNDKGGDVSLGSDSQRIGPDSAKLNGPPKRLNIGCGRRFHRDWVNVDLVPCHPQVLQCDIVQGLPFSEDTFAAIYHSHVLEHLSLNQGQALLEDCFRVLSPGGFLRIVVPDLEQIARLYLEMHELAWHGDRSSIANYEWMKLELLDQLVRSHSGGMMGQFMAQLDQTQADFVRSRAGVEFDLCRGIAQGSIGSHGTANSGDSKTRIRSVSNANPYVRPNWRQRFCRWLIKRFLGQDSARAFDESLFRNAGEIHRWMYDRFSLRNLCERVGFVNFRVCSAFESSIEHFSSFQLDTAGATVYKPDSLFVECEKPRAVSQTKVAAA